MRTLIEGLGREDARDQVRDRLNKAVLFSALRVSGIFTLLGVFWIVASDRILLRMVPDAGTITAWQTYKGWAFVLASALLIHWLLIRELQGRMQAESSLRIALDAARLGYWDLNLVENYTRRSLRHDQIFGYQTLQAEWNYEIFLKHVLPEDRAHVAECFSRALSQGDLNLDCRIRWADRTTHWIEVRGRADFSANGRPIRVVGVVIDATERKRGEEALRESEQSFRAIFENHHAVMLIIDPGTGRIVDGSPGACSFYGYSREELKKKRITEINTLPSEQVFERMQMAKAQQRRYFDFEHCLAGGQVRDVEVCTGPIVVGGRTLLFSVLNDVTDRKRAENALRESEERYHTLFDQSKDGVFITTRDGKLVEANQAYLDLLGITREEARNLNILDTYAEPAADSRQHFRQDIEKTGSVKDYEITLKTKDGRLINCLSTSTVKRAPDGTIIGYQGIVRDVTEHKRLQHQLIQAQKMEAIGTLAGGIAHDFNNLLTIIMGYSELLVAEKEQDDREYADLQKIFHAAKNGAYLVHRLLMFSRKAEPRLVPMNLNTQIVEVENLLRRTIPRMIDIHLDLSADVPEINADPSQMEQVLMNLAVNARDAMADVGKLIVRTSPVALDEEYCRVHLEVSPGEYLLLEISDTGHGMDKETVKHIFEPFFTTKEIGKGTGLGLATVYGIVKKHNGHITVYSEVGKGTTFRVYLPATQSPVKPGVKDSGIIPAMGTETVLLVDDDESVRELGARILTKHGYTVVEVENGREALNLFKRERSHISLVILDLIMPEMGGIECLKGLLEIDPKVNVLAASGYSADASVNETIEMGAKGFVSKPFRAKELLRDVRRVLDEGPQVGRPKSPGRGHDSGSVLSVRV